MDLFGSSNNYGWQLRNNGIYLGEDLDAHIPCYLNLDWLRTHLYIDAPTGRGKTSVIRHLTRYLSHVEEASVILISEKGELAPNCRDAAIYDGFASRLEFVDFSDPNIAVSYNPLKESGLPMSSHAKALTEACRSAWGQADFDKTPQLRRFLFATFFVALEQRLTMTQAIDILRPFSPLRVQLLPEIKDSFSKSMFLWFDGLRDTRQEELTASTLARLEPFVADPLVRRVIANPYPSLSMSDVVNHHKFLILNLEVYRPWRPDDIRLIGRLFINSLIAQVFNRPKGKRTPVFLVIDELADFITDDLARALEQGRELGLHCILSTQFENQLQREDGTGRLRESVLHNAQTKLVFSGVDPVLSRDYLESIFFSTLDPYRVKDEIRGLELIPHESSRIVTGHTKTASIGHGVSFPETESIGKSDSYSRGRERGRSLGTQESETESESKALAIGNTLTRGTSLSLGKSITDAIAFSLTRAQAKTNSEAKTHTEGENRNHSIGRAHTHTEGNNHTDGQSHGNSSGTNLGSNSQSGNGLSFDSDGRWVSSANSSSGFNSGSFDSYSDAYSSSDTYSSSDSDTESESDSYGSSRSDSISVGHAKTESEALTQSINKSLSRSLALGLQLSLGETQTDTKTKALANTRGRSTTLNESESESSSNSLTHGRSRGITPSITNTEGISESVSVQPFYEYEIRRPVTSRTFMPTDEQLLLQIQKLNSLPVGCGVILVPGHHPVFLRLPYSEPIELTPEEVEAELIEMYAQPHYTRIEAIEAQERAQLADFPTLSPIMEETYVGNIFTGESRVITPSPKARARAKAGHQSPQVDLAKAIKIIKDKTSR